MEVERAVPAFRVFKDEKITKVFFFGGFTRNSWEKIIIAVLALEFCSLGFDTFRRETKWKRSLFFFPPTTERAKEGFGYRGKR